LIVTLFINVFSFTFSFYESYWRTSATLPLNLHLVHLSVCLFVFLSFCLSVYLSFCHSIFTLYFQCLRESQTGAACYTTPSSSCPALSVLQSFSLSVYAPLIVSSYTSINV
jgi:hypothetical protein